MSTETPPTPRPWYQRWFPVTTALCSGIVSVVEGFLLSLGFIFSMPFRRPWLLFMLSPEILLLTAQILWIYGAERGLGAGLFLLFYGGPAAIILRILALLFFLIRGSAYLSSGPSNSFLRRQFYEKYKRFPTPEELETLYTPEDRKILDEQAGHAWFYRGESIFYKLWTLYYVGFAVCCLLAYNGMIGPPPSPDEEKLFWVLRVATVAASWPFTPFLMLFPPN